jgi:hypothetical protein
LDTHVGIKGHLKEKELQEIQKATAEGKPIEFIMAIQDRYSAETREGIRRLDAMQAV